MAIENAKTLNVRIKNKYDSYEKWAASGLVLEAGEIAIAYTTVDVKVDNGTAKHPALLMKVGDGEKTFANLPWLSAKAADVLEACKSTDALTTFVNNVIADAGIASSDAMEALSKRVTTAEGAIDALEELVGTTKVADQITAAINALNLADTYAPKTHGHAISEVDGLSDALAGKEAAGEAAKVQTALNEYKTSNDAAVQKNATDIAGEISRAKAAEEANAGAITAIKDGTTIDSFADVEAALAGKQATGDYATKAEAQAMADAKDSAIAEAKKAGTDAAAAAAAAQADADALELLVGTTKVSEQISGAIDDLDLANTYAAKSHTHTKSEITDFAHTHEIAEVNGLQTALDGKQAVGDYATKTEAQGYADAKDEAIEAAQAAADKAQEEVDALETYVGTIPTDEKYADITNVISYVNKKAEETLAAAQGGSSETAASVKQQLDNYKSENDTRVGQVEDSIAAINNADTGILAQAKEYADGKDTAIEAAQNAGDDAMAEAQKKVASVTAADASVTIGGTATAPTVAAKLSADADNALELAEDGLKVVIPAAAEYSIVKAADSGDYAAVYNLTKDGAIVGTSINIPKDMVVKSGSVVNDEIVLVLNDEAATEIKIPVASLIEYVTSGSQTGDMVVINVSDDHKVTATITDGTITLAKLHTDVQTAIGKAHSHENADVLAGITADKVADWDAAEENAKDYADGLDSAMNERVEALEAIDHDHANKAELDLVATGDVAKWNAAEQNAKDYADGLNTEMNTRVEALEAIDHSHANATVLDGITAEKVAAWDKVSEKANDADLAAIAKTGNVNDLVQTEGDVLIFDCGTSAV